MSKYFYSLIIFVWLPLFSMEPNQPEFMVELDKDSFIDYKRELSLIVYAGSKVTNPNDNKALQFYTDLYSKFANPLVQTYSQFYSIEERAYISQKFSEHFSNKECQEAYLLATATNTQTAWNSFLKKAYHAGKLIGEKLGVNYSKKPGPHNYVEFLELNHNIQEPTTSYLKCGAIIFYLKQMKRLNVK